MIEHRLQTHPDVPLLPYKILRAGDLTCILEAGNIRYITCGSTEVIRMIYPAVRGRNWITVIPVISDEILNQNENGYDISYNANYNSGDIHFVASIRISIEKNNTISFSYEGKALNDFQKNRIGICVLHPMKECTGKEVTITEPEGTSYKSIFPELISPHQLLKNIKKLQWQPAMEIDAEVKMSGDIFETEDQRNWGDNSFKTYSTPLEIPFPALIRKGETVQQQVLLSVVTKKKHTSIPRIGIRKNHDQSLPVLKIMGDRFQVHHHRVELYLYQPGWTERLAESTKDKVKLELIVFFDNNYDVLEEFSNFISPFTEYIYSILLLDRNAEVTPPGLMEKGYTTIKTKFPSLQVGYGTDGYFANINRSRPGNLPHDFISFSSNPQAHATDTRTIIENLESYPSIIRTAKSFTNKRIHVSPLTINERSIPGSNEKDSREEKTSACYIPR
jgi:hypothetical protein